MAGLISEVPGFERPERPEEPVGVPAAPLISSVPGLTTPAPEPSAADEPAPPAPPAPLGGSMPIAPPSLSAAIPANLAPAAPPSLTAAVPTELAPPPPPAPEPQVDLAPPPPPPPPPPSVEAALTTAEVALPPAPPEVVEAPVAAVPPVDDASDIEDIDATRLVARPPRLVLRWDDGTVTTIEASAVIGRDPVGQHGETPAAIDDSSRSLSKTHARFIAGYSPSVEDLHSTNGVRIERAGVPVAVPPGQAITLRPGDEVVCGTRRLTIEVQA